MKRSEYQAGRSTDRDNNSSADRRYSRPAPTPHKFTIISPPPVEVVRANRSIVEPSASAADGARFDQPAYLRRGGAGGGRRCAAPARRAAISDMMVASVVVRPFASTSLPSGAILGEIQINRSNSDIAQAIRQRALAGVHG